MDEESDDHLGNHYLLNKIQYKILDNDTMLNVQKDYFIKQTLMTNQTTIGKNLKTDKAESNNNEDDDIKLTTNTKKSNKIIPSQLLIEPEKPPEGYINCKINGVKYLLKFNHSKSQIQYYNPLTSQEDQKSYFINYDTIKELIAGQFNSKNNKAIVSIIYKENAKKKLDVILTGVEDYDYFVKNFNAIII